MLLFVVAHPIFGVDRYTSMNGDAEVWATEEDSRIMYDRAEERIEMQLPCRLEFPNVWAAAVEGFTANLNRKGVAVACQVKPGKTLPQIGAQASVHIELPPASNFPPKFMSCETTLLRIDAIGDSEFQFALRIRNVDFADISPAAIHMMELDSDTCRYFM